MILLLEYVGWGIIIGMVLKLAIVYPLTLLERRSIRRTLKEQGKRDRTRRYGVQRRNRLPNAL